MPSTRSRSTRRAFWFWSRNPPASPHSRHASRQPRKIPRDFRSVFPNQPHAREGRDKSRFHSSILYSIPPRRRSRGVSPSFQHKWLTLIKTLLFVKFLYYWNDSTNSDWARNQKRSTGLMAHTSPWGKTQLLAPSRPLTRSSEMNPQHRTSFPLIKISKWKRK